MAEKKTNPVEIQEMNEEESKAFESVMDSLRMEMMDLHQRSIIMEHEAQQGAAHAFLIC